MPAKKTTKKKTARKQAPLEFDIENIGGIEEIHLEFSKGMNVLRGPNGIGKTSSINALRRAHGEQIVVDRRDGADHGTVYSGDVLLLKVGQVARATGKAEVSISDTSPVATVIDPRIQDPVPRATARIRGLVELLELGVEKRFIHILAASDKGLVKFALHTAEEEVIEDLLVLSGRMKKHAEGLARAQETAVDEARGREEELQHRRAEAIQQLGGEENLVDISPEAAAEALVEASKELERTEAQHQARMDLEASQARVREALGDRVDPAAAANQLRNGAKRLARDKDNVARLRAELEGAEDKVTVSEAIMEDYQRDEASAREADQILAKTPEGPDDDALHAALKQVHDVKITQQQATLSSTARQAGEDAQGCADTVAACEKEAVRLRDLGQGIPGRLAAVLEDAGAPGLTVVDGRLAVIEGKGKKAKIMDFESRQSEGQRATVVLAIAARRYKGLMPIAWQFWASLDPAAKAHFAKTCVEMGLYGITEKTADGDLRVEHMG